MRAAERAEQQAREETPETPPPRPRHPVSNKVWLLVGIGVVVIGVWLAFATLQLLRARDEALAGLDDVEQLRSSISVESIDSGEHAAAFRAANARFERANERAESPALMPLRYLPVLGRQVRSVDALTDAAAEVTDVAEQRLDDARALLDSADVQPAGRVAFVRSMQQLAEASSAQLDDVQLGPADGLLGPLQRARNRFDDELTSLRTSADHIGATSEALALLLEGPRNYLLLAANNAEMRVGSGSFLSLGVLSTNNGSLDLGDMEQAAQYALPDDRVALTGELADRWGFLAPNREWRNLASSPRFDVNAELAARMWEASTGQEVDGILALDIVAVQALLAATGPVVVDGVTLSPNNVIEDVMLRHYLRLGPDETEEDRREHFSQVATAVVDKLESEEWDPYTLASRLVDVAAGRHVLLWSRDASEQAGWDAVSLSGRLEPNSLMVGLHNRGGNKLDQFMQVNGRVTTRKLLAGTEVTVDVSIRNGTPPGLPSKIVGPFRGAIGSAEGRYQGLVVFQIPGAAENAEIKGVTDPVANGPDGETQVVAAYIELDRGAALDRTITFMLPNTEREIRVEPSARIPGIGWTAEGERWVDDKPRTLSW